MFAPTEDFEENDQREEDIVDDDEDEDYGWEDRWEKMQEGAVKEKRREKTLKRLKSIGEY